MDRIYQIVITALISVAVGVFAGVFGARVSERISIDWPASIKSASDLMTVIGILIAGIWSLYLIQRRRSLEPRAALVHHVQLWELGSDTFLRLSVEVQNPSEVIIRPGDGSTSVQRPPRGHIDPRQYAVNLWEDIVKIRHCLGFEDVSIDPKESETYTHDIKLPNGIRFIQITTEMACVRTKEMKQTLEQGRPKEDLVIDDATDRWTLTTLLDLAQLSGTHSRQHSSANLSETRANLSNSTLASNS